MSSSEGAKPLWRCSAAAVCWHHPRLNSAHSALQEALDELIRDFANPDAGDHFFPFARMFDWYEGHSWAAGITPFAAGKNQVRFDRS
jgi:endoglucanase Acf2